MDIEKQQDVVYRIHDTYGVPQGFGPTEAGFYSKDKDLYRFIAVCKSSDNVYYEGVDEIEEAYEKASDVLFDSAVDSELGVYLVVAIVDTTDGSIIYPDYAVTFAFAGSGNLSQYAG